MTSRRRTDTWLDNRYVNVAGDTMTGSLNCDGTVSVDTIAERTSGVGVTIDGVLCKDGTLKCNMANTSYEIKEITFAGQQYPAVFPTSSVPSYYSFIVGGLIEYDPTYNFPGLTLYEYTGGTIQTSHYASIVYNRATYGGLYFATGFPPIVGGGDIIFDPDTNIIRGFLNNDISLGSSSYEFKDLYIDGWAYIDSLRSDVEFDIDGTLDITGISATGTVSSQTKYMPVDDGGTTRYIALYDSVS